MKISDLVTQVKLSDIDSTDQTFYVLDSGSDTTSLALSIQQVGLITPVLLRPADNKYIIISGFNRVNACRLNQKKHIDAILVESDLDYIDCLSKAISAVSFKRVLTQPEIIKCIGLLSDHLSFRQISELSRAVFNTRMNEPYISSMIQIGSLPDPGYALIRSGRLSIKSAKILLNFPSEDLPAVLSIFNHIKASSSVQLEMLTHFKEICKRDGLSMADLVDRYQVNALLDSDDKDMVLKTRQIRRRFFDIRFPHLSQAQKKKKNTVSNVGHGTPIKIEISDNFENPDVLFSFTADSSDTFEEQIQNLKKLACHSDFKEIFIDED